MLEGPTLNMKVQLSCDESQFFQFSLAACASDTFQPGKHRSKELALESEVLDWKGLWRWASSQPSSAELSALDQVSCRFAWLCLESH